MMLAVGTRLLQPPRISKVLTDQIKKESQDMRTGEGQQKAAVWRDVIT